MNLKDMKVIESAVFVVCSPRMPSPERNAGGSKAGTQTTLVKQQVLTETFLRPLATIKSQIRRTLIAVGTPLDSISGWMIPLSVWEETNLKLTKAKESWGATAAAMEGMLSAEVDALCAQDPAHEAGIRAHCLSAGKWREATKFIYGAIKVGKEQIVEGGSLAEEISGLAGQVLSDLVKMVIDGKRDSGTGNYEANATREFIGAMAAKAHAFEFLDPRIGEVAQVLEQVVKVLPTTGRLKDAHEALATTLFARIKDVGGILQGGLDLSKEIDAVKAMVANPVPVPPVVTVIPVSPEVQAMKSRVKPRPAKVVPAAQDVVKAQADTPMPAYNPVCI